MRHSKAPRVAAGVILAAGLIAGPAMAQALTLTATPSPLTFSTPGVILDGGNTAAMLPPATPAGYALASIEIAYDLVAEANSSFAVPGDYTGTGVVSLSFDVTMTLQEGGPLGAVIASITGSDSVTAAPIAGTVATLQPSISLVGTSTVTASDAGWAFMQGTPSFSIYQSGFSPAVSLSLDTASGPHIIQLAPAFALIGDIDLRYTYQLESQSAGVPLPAALPLLSLGIVAMATRAGPIRPALLV